jgi:tetratricopeptide (TPR) repeat protein
MKLLQWLISKFKGKPEQGSVAPEKWESRFQRPGKNRFSEEDGEKYRVRISRGDLALELQDFNLFAWTLNPVYRYRNFVLDVDISFDPENGHCAAGAIFRYVSEENYYYALISEDGHFRFDVVFNANPITLIPWMKIEQPETEVKAQTAQPSSFRFRIIAHETTFAFFVDGEWIAELDDEMIDTGYIAFAGQNYDERERARFHLHELILESRPMEVEVLFQRWVNYLEPDVERRKALARRLYEMEQYTAALIQLKKAFRSREPAAGERFFLVETLIQLRMYEQALAQVEKCLEADADFHEGKIEKANLLYLLNRFIDTKAWLEEILPGFPEHAPLRNLLGNTEFSLGNWESAAARYEEVLEIEPEMPIFLLNAARAHDYAGNKERAVELYRSAAIEFFRQEAYEELMPIRSRMGELAPEDPLMKSIEGKLRFQDGNLPEAERIFFELIDEDHAESDVFFLEGVVRMQAGKPEEAAEYFRTAAEQEPEFHLYRLKLAESLHLAGLPAEEELNRALELAPEDGWICNLAGLMALERGDYSDAVLYLRKAYEVLPEEREVQLNYSNALYHSEGIERAEEVITDTDDPYALNHRGNMYADNGRLEEAVELYRKALEHMPEEPVFLENISSALMSEDHYAEAEEQLVRLLDTGAGVSTRAYEMIAEVAKEKGEFERAATTLEEALKIEPENSKIRLSLARLLVRRNRWEDARGHLESLRTNGDAERAAEAEELMRKVREATETRYECSSCGREWWVHNDIEPPERVRLYGEPPRESPAGKCDSCGRIYCIECALQHMEGNRFTCPHCGIRLKLSDGGLKYLAVRYAEQNEES